MNIKIILLGLFTLSFVQCTTHTTDTTIGYKFSNQETLVFEDIDYPEILGDIMQIIKDRKSTRLNSSHEIPTRMPSSA